MSRSSLYYQPVGYDPEEQALMRYGQPEIFNTDQGSEFTDKTFTRTLVDRGVKVSMDGKGRCLDNVFVERPWRSFAIYFCGEVPP
ncbi:MAG: transposase family protein [Deltaproteobacteria bacterium]|nr:transposase family protein [Deltaproteobacteria bacterium]